MGGISSSGSFAYTPPPAQLRSNHSCTPRDPLLHALDRLRHCICRIRASRPTAVFHAHAGRHTRALNLWLSRLRQWTRCWVRLDSTAICHCMGHRRALRRSWPFLRVLGASLCYVARVKRSPAFGQSLRWERGESSSGTMARVRDVVMAGKGIERQVRGTEWNWSRVSRFWNLDSS